MNPSAQPSGPESRWYALYVRSRAEKYVALQLENKRLEVYVPLYWSRRKWADRWKTVGFPLFPGYVFCQFDEAQRSSVYTTAGVIDIVHSGNELVPVRTCELEAIRKMTESQVAVEPYPGLVRGQRVRMQSGPLKGIEGTILEIKNSLRLIVSVEMLQRSVTAEIEPDWIAPREPIPPRQPSWPIT